MRQFAVSGLPRLQAHGHQAQCRVAHLHHRVHRGGREAVQVLSKGARLVVQPGSPGPQVILEGLGFAGQHGRGGVAAVAHHLSCDALAVSCSRPAGSGGE